MSYSFDDIEVRQARITSAIWLTIAAGLAVVAAIFLQGPQVALTKEHGGAELATVALIVILALWFMVTGAATRRFWMIPAVLVLFALRERDFHNWFYEPGWLHAGVLQGANPLWQKLVTGAAMAVILVIFALMVIRGAKPFLAAFFTGQAWAWWLVGGGIFGVLSQTLDGAGRKLAPYDITISPALDRALGMTEELSELGLILCVLWAVALFKPRSGT